MENTTVKTVAKISLFFVLHLLLYHFYVALRINTLPWEGDSIDYHIPIAKLILNGQFFAPSAQIPQQYYPGASELILAVFMFLHIPLNLYNVLAWIVLFFVCVKLARVFNLDYYFAILFATTVVTLNTIVRWLLAQTIDIWLVNFFILSLVLLERPKKSIVYFVWLGIFLGMLLGSKYTGIGFFIVLIAFYSNKLLRFLDLKRFAGFLVPFSIFGIFWYARNYMLLGNPLYPLNFLFFQGEKLFTDNIWSVTLAHPIQMVNAFIAEYKIWSVSVVFAPFALFYLVRSKIANIDVIKKVFLLGIINFIFYPFFPTSNQEWIMVSSLRYSYPAFIPLILGFFLLAERFKKKEFLSLIAAGNMILLHPLTYYPKLVFLYIPFAFFLFRIIENKRVKKLLKL